jgi:Fic family protein
VTPKCTKAAQANGPGIRSRRKSARSTLEPCLGFKNHRALWNELLNEVRLYWTEARGIGFFAERIEASATQAVATATALLALVNADRDRIAGLGRAAASALAVHQALQRQPIATSAALVKATRLTPATVNKSLAHLERLGIVVELTNRQRGRVFSYRRYVEELAAELEEPA